MVRKPFDPCHIVARSFDLTIFLVKSGTKLLEDFLGVGRVHR